MKEIQILFFSFLFFLTLQKKEENEELTFLNEQKDFNLTILTETNFSSLKNNSLILFYSSTCEACKIYKKFFLSLISKFKEINYPCEFAVINAVKYKNLTDKYEIKFFPTLKFFYNNKFYYINDRTDFEREEKILHYLNKIKNGFVTKINNIENIKNYFNNNKIILLSTLKEKNSLKNFEDFSEKTFDLISFLHCDSEECKTKYENEIVLFKINNNQIVLTKKFSDEMHHRNFSFKNIKFFLSNFIIENGEKIPKNIIEILFDYNRSALIFITNDFNENNSEIKIIKEIFESYKNQIYFFFLDLKDKIEINKNLIEFLEIDSTTNSKIFIIQPNDNDSDDANVYEFKEKITKQSIINFIQDFFHNKLLKILESEKIPSEDEQKEFEFKLIVGKNFDQEITFNNNSNDILLIIINQDFEVKEKMLNMFNKLANKYNNNNNELNLKFCVTKMPENEIRGSNPSRIPSIYLYKKNNKLNPIPYPREIKSDFNEILLLSWIEQNLNINNNNNNNDINNKGDL